MKKIDVFRTTSGHNLFHSISRTVALEIGKKYYVPLHDMRGNISTLVDLEGNVAEEYRYSVFGEREILSLSGEKKNQSGIDNPWQYSGKRFDEESGLIAFGMHYYAPSQRYHNCCK